MVNYGDPSVLKNPRLLMASNIGSSREDSFENVRDLNHANTASNLCGITYS